MDCKNIWGFTSYINGHWHLLRASHFSFSHFLSLVLSASCTGSSTASGIRCSIHGPPAECTSWRGYVIMLVHVRSSLLMVQTGICHAVSFELLTSSPMFPEWPLQCTELPGFKIKPPGLKQSTVTSAFCAFVRCPISTVISSQSQVFDCFPKGSFGSKNQVNRGFHKVCSFRLSLGRFILRCIKYYIIIGVFSIYLPP